MELLLADYTRRGWVDGIAIRLPTICVRPGEPNLAASGFFSNIIREPLHGRPAVLPVSREVRHWFASPRAAVGFLLHAATMDTTALGLRRSLTMPGLSATVAKEIEALRRVAGDDAVALIRAEPDEAIARIVGGVAARFDARRASAWASPPSGPSTRSSACTWRTRWAAWWAGCRGPALPFRASRGRRRGSLEPEPRSRRAGGR